MYCAHTPKLSNVKIAGGSTSARQEISEMEMVCNTTCNIASIVAGDKKTSLDE